MARLFGECELNVPALASQKIPAQTYDYVFYIFSAAVIGEDPRLFGLDLENPLQKVGI